MEVGEEKEVTPKQTVPLTPEELGKLSFVERQRLRTKSQRQLTALFKDPETKKTLREEVLEGAKIIRKVRGRVDLLKELLQKTKVIKGVRMACYFPRCPEIPKNFLTVAEGSGGDHPSLYGQYIDWCFENSYEFRTVDSSYLFKSGVAFSVNGVDGPIIFFDNLDEKINVPQIKRMGYVVLNEEFEIQ